MLVQQQAMMNNMTVPPDMDIQHRNNRGDRMQQRKSSVNMPKNVDGPRVHNDPEPGVIYPDESEILGAIDRRNAARRVANYKEADKIRDELRLKGIALLDDP